MDEKKNAMKRGDIEWSEGYALYRLYGIGKRARKGGGTIYYIFRSGHGPTQYFSAFRKLSQACDRIDWIHDHS